MGYVQIVLGILHDLSRVVPPDPPVSFSILSPRNGIGRIIDFSAQQETRKIRWFLLRYISKFFHELHLFFFLFNLMQVLFLSQA